MMIHVLKYKKAALANRSSCARAELSYSLL